jgi:Fuc2NAc and GlcNAc transferase
MVPGWIILIATQFTFAALATRWLLSYCEAKGYWDVPNERSSHDRIVPRGGGLAIVAGVGIILTAMAWGQRLTELRAFQWSALAGLCAVALAGWWDDTRHFVSIRGRLLFQTLAALLAVSGMMGAFSDQILEITGSSPPVMAAFALAAVLGLIWVTNLYNFMDGIDGIAGVEGVTVALASAFLAEASGDTWLATMYLAIGAATAGFLLFNWAPARIFMGDVGSGSLGFLFGVLALVGHLRGTLPLVCSATLLAVFVTDATVLLVRRMLNGEKFWLAHRDHAYQKLVQAGASHATLSAAVGLVNLLWLTPLAFRASVSWRWAILAYVPVVAYVVFCQMADLPRWRGVLSRKGETP